MSRKAKRRRRSSGSKRRRRNPQIQTSARRTRGFSRRRSRRNPVGVGIPGYTATSLIKVGVGAVAGSIGARGLTQAALQANNTGYVGYLGNLASTWLLAWLAGRFAGTDYAVGVAGGGISATMLRIWNEKISQTSPAALSGLGDLDFSSSGLGEYVDTQFPTPSVPRRSAGGLLVNNSPVAAAIAAKAIVPARAAGGAGPAWSSPW